MRNVLSPISENMIMANERKSVSDTELVPSSTVDIVLGANPVKKTRNEMCTDKPVANCFSRGGWAFGLKLVSTGIRKVVTIQN